MRLNRLNLQEVMKNGQGQWELMIVCAVLAVFILACFPAAGCADTGKKISRLLSSVERKIVTQPKAAEKEWLEAQTLIEELTANDQGHKQLADFEKKLESLGKKLEKRLHHPIGQAASEKTADKKGPPKKEIAEETAKKSELSSTVLSYLKRINASLDAAEAGVEKYRLQTAKRKVKEADKNMEEMLKRYGKKIPQGNQEVEDAKKRLETVTASYEKAQNLADARAAEEAEAKQKCEAQSEEWMEKFAPFFEYNSDLYLRIGSDFNTGTEEEKKGYRKAYEKAGQMMGEFEKTEFPYGKTYELAGQEMRLADLLMMYNEGEKREKKAQACKKWMDTLREYADVGAGSDKYLIVSTTYDKNEINRRAALLKEAEGVWTEYQKAEFPLGKTLELIDLEKDLEKTLKEMPESIRQSRALISDQVEKEYDDMLSRLNRDTGWKTDKKKMPFIAMERDLKPLREALKQYAGTVKPGDAKLLSLQKKMELIEKTDEENRAVCAQRRFMRPWKYPGSDGDDLEDKVKTILKKKDPKSKLLRITLPNENWKEEKVLEYTDTTKTAVRYRHTRHIQGEIAAKAADGKVYLHCVYLASDRTSSGNWGPLYGHVMYSDWMAEENVNKKP